MSALSLDTVKVETCEFHVKDDKFYMPNFLMFGILFLPTFIKVACFSPQISNRAELMKKSNGAYFPEEVFFPSKY